MCVYFVYRFLSRVNIFLLIVKIKRTNLKLKRDRRKKKKEKKKEKEIRKIIIYVCLLCAKRANISDLIALWFDFLWYWIIIYLKDNQWLLLHLSTVLELFNISYSFKHTHTNKCKTKNDLYFKFTRYHFRMCVCMCFVDLRISFFDYLILSTFLIFSIKLMTQLS